MPPYLFAGVATASGLIVSIGAQNGFVLRQGLLRHRVGIVVAICILSELVLICAGTAGLGGLVGDHPRVLTVLRWAGAAYLLSFAVRSFRSALRPQSLAAGGASDRSVVGTTLAITWLNPHVYLDTVLLLGALANQHGPSGRWWFAAGAWLVAIVWFVGLGYGAAALSPVLARPRTWQVLDGLIGVMMVVVAVVLVQG